MKALILTLLSVSTILLAQTPDTPPPPPSFTVPVPDSTEATKPVEIPKVAITPEQATSIITQLDKLDKTASKSRGDAMGIALQRCKAASAGEKEALDLYIACYKTEHFDKLNLKPTDFTEWKQHNEDHFKDQEFLGSLLLQVRFLTLSIQAQDAKEKDMPGIITGLQGVISDMIRVIQGSVVHTTSGAVKENEKGKKPAVKMGGGGRTFDSAQLMRRLEQSVKESEFAKAFQLQDYLVREDWNYIPSEIGEIYDTVIFPYYLGKKPTDLPAQWDLKIKDQLAFKQALFTDVEYQLYYTNHYPDMLWKKNKYLLANNVNTVLALADMLKVIRTYPTHPKAGDWIKEIREIVNKSQEPTTSPGLNENPATPPTAAK